MVVFYIVIKILVRLVSVVSRVLFQILTIYENNINYLLRKRQYIAQKVSS